MTKLTPGPNEEWCPCCDGGGVISRVCGRCDGSGFIKEEEKPTMTTINEDQLRDALSGLQLETLDNVYDQITGEYGYVLKFAGDIQVRFEAECTLGVCTLKVRMRKPADWTEIA